LGVRVIASFARRLPKASIFVVMFFILAAWTMTSTNVSDGGWACSLGTIDRRATHKKALQKRPNLCRGKYFIKLSLDMGNTIMLVFEHTHTGFNRLDTIINPRRIRAGKKDLATLTLVYKIKRYAANGQELVAIARVFSE
jgi:hypothetical protein